MVRTSTHVAINFSKRRKSIRENSLLKREQKIAEKKERKKKKPNDAERAIAKLFRDSTKVSRTQQYSKAKILSVTGAPYWPPLTRQIIESIKNKKSIENVNFSFSIVSSTTGRVVFSTTMKADGKPVPKTKSFFEIDFGQRTIRYTPNWKRIQELAKTNPKAARLLASGERRI